MAMTKKPQRKHQKAPPKKVEKLEQKSKAIQMRMLRFSYRAIAERLGITHTTAERWVAEAMGEYNQTRLQGAEKLRERELAHLDYLITKLAPKIEAGDTGAIGSAVRVSERRARLLGLDAPAKVEVTNTVLHIDYSKLSDGELQTLQTLLDKSGVIDAEPAEDTAG
jgi:hypothetical protein